MAKAWVILDWDAKYENAGSRKVKACSWVCTPNTHDGEGYRRLMMMPRGLELFGAWNLIIQLASKMPVRGVLADERKPLTPEGMAFKTGAPAEAFEATLAACSSESIGWVAQVEFSGSALPERPSALPVHPNVPALYRTEHTEHTEQKRRDPAARFEVDCERFIREYPKTVSDWDIQILLSEVRAQADQDRLFNNLGLYQTTDQWQRGIVPSAENWLKKGFWKVAPKVEAKPKPGEITDADLARIEAEVRGIR